MQGPLEKMDLIATVHRITVLNLSVRIDGCCRKEA